MAAVSAPDVHAKATEIRRVFAMRHWTLGLGLVLLGVSGGAWIDAPLDSELGTWDRTPWVVVTVLAGIACILVVGTGLVATVRHRRSLPNEVTLILRQALVISAAVILIVSSIQGL